MERSIEILAVIQVLLLGVSHIVKREAWAEFFIALSKQGHAGVFFHGFLSLWFGSLVVAFHPIWRGIPAVLTFWGALLVLKALHCFLFPEAALRSLKAVSLEGAWKFIPAGILYLVIGGLIAFHLCRDFV